MNPTVFILGLVFAAVAAIPESPEIRQASLVERLVAAEIEKISEQIREDGLDPFFYTDAVDLRVPVTDLMVLSAHVENFIMDGLSDIVVYDVTYRPISSRVSFDIGIPRLSLTADSAAVDASFFGYKIDADVHGRINVINARAEGDALISLSNFEITFRSLTIDFTIQAIQSNLIFKALGEDMSQELNHMISNDVYDIVVKNYEDINKVIEYYLLDLLPTSD